MSLTRQAVHQGDCIELLKQLEPNSVDLVFADPPFNIGYSYDVYQDKKPYEQYLDWSREWMSGVVRALKEDGTFWLAIGDEYAAELKILAQRELGLTTRSWVLWYYTFGVNCKRNFSRSHTHLFHFVKNEKRFTFNAEDPAVRVPSARQLVYGDKRANSQGRLPDNTWILRPQDLPDGFQPDQDTWYFARVAGTFKERAGFHGCQMPEQLLGRILRVSSNPGELVLDPFAGSGSTLIVAKKLHRDWLGFELSKKYVKQVNERLNSVSAGEELVGPADPLRSAPSTRQGTKLDANGQRRKNGHDPEAENDSPERDELPRSGNGKSPLAGNSNAEAARSSGEPAGTENVDQQQAIIEAYLQSHEGFSTDRILADPKLNRAFLAACRDQKIAGKPADWNHLLLKLRKSRKLPRLQSRPAPTLSAREMDMCIFGSEIAMALLAEEEEISIDEILCRPALAKKFDQLAASYAPGFKPLEYRWAALALRKKERTTRRTLESIGWRFQRSELPRATRLGKLKCDSYAEVAGAYLLKSKQQAVYAGDTFNLAERLRLHQRLAQQPPWKQQAITSVVVVPEAEDHSALALQLAYWYQPELNPRQLEPV